MDADTLYIYRRSEHLEAIYRLTDGIPISLNMMCKILHIGRTKARKMLGTRVRLVEDAETKSANVNLADVLQLAGRQI